MPDDRPAPVAPTLTSAQRWYVSWTADLLVYTVVLNLFDEYVEGVRIESFTISILTAALLKIMLVLLGGIEHRVHHYFANRDEGWARPVGAVLIFGILFGGKLLILEVVNLVFGDEVELGRIIEVVALILTMMLSRAVMDRIFRRLGTTEAT